MLDRVEFGPSQTKIGNGRRAELILVSSDLYFFFPTDFVNELFHIGQVAEFVCLHARVVNVLEISEIGGISDLPLL